MLGKKRKAAVAILLSVAFLSFLLLLHFRRPTVNVVLSESEMMLYGDSFKFCLLPKYRFVPTTGPDTEYRYHLYSPLYYFSSPSRPLPDSAIFGVGEAEDGFRISFIKDDSRMWGTAYGMGDDTLFSSCVLYDDDDREEVKLLESVPDGVMRFSYGGEISKVYAEKLRGDLENAKVQTLVVFSPEKCMNLLTMAEGYRVVTSYVYDVGLDTFKIDALVSPDFNMMARILISGEEGEVETSYRLRPRDGFLEVLLHYLF